MDLHGGALGAVLGALAELRYGVAYRVLDAQHFGVPQRRRRVVFVGCLGNWAAPVQVLLEPEGSRRHPAPRRPTRPRTAPVAALSASDGGADDNDATGGRLIAATLTAAAATQRTPGRHREDDSNLVVGPLQAEGANGRGHRVDAEGAANGHLIINSLTAHAGRNDPSADPLLPVAFDTAQITHPENRVNPRPGDPAMPLAATGAAHVAFVGEHGDRQLVPISRTVGVPRDAAAAAAVRRLTPLECERLQGFPDGWTATSDGRPQSDSARYRQLGNSIALPVFVWVAGRLVVADREMMP